MFHLSSLYSYPPTYAVRYINSGQFLRKLTLMLCYFQWSKSADGKQYEGQIFSLVVSCFQNNRTSEQLRGLLIFKNNGSSCKFFFHYPSTVVEEKSVAFTWCHSGHFVPLQQRILMIPTLPLRHFFVSRKCIKTELNKFWWAYFCYFQEKMAHLVTWAWARR